MDLAKIHRSQTHIKLVGLLIAVAILGVALLILALQVYAEPPVLQPRHKQELIEYIELDKLEERVTSLEQLQE